MSEKQSDNGGDHEGQEEETVEAKSRTESSAHPEQSNVEAESAPPQPEISRSHKPLEGLTTRKSLNRSVFSKPKSRFGEQPAPIDSCVLEETSLEQVGADFTSFKEGSPMRILMESPEKALEGNEVGILEMQSAKGVEVGKEETVEAKGPLLKGSESSAPEQSSLNLPVSAESFRAGSPPPEIHISSRRNSLTRSALSKPKSRFGEQSMAIDSNILEESILEQDFPFGGFFDEVSAMSMSKKQSADGHEVVIGVRCEETTELKRSSSKGSESCTLEQIDVDVAVSVAVDFPSPEISKSSPNPGKLHMNPIHSLTRIRTLKRSDESRGDGDSPYAESFHRGWSDEEADEEIYKKAISRYKHMKVKKKILTEWIIFLCSLGVLMASLTVKKLVNVMVWGLEFWKWCVLFMVIFNGMLVASLFMHFTVVVTEKNTLLRKKVLYFLLGIKKNVEVVIWLALVLLTWLCLFNSKIERSKTSTKIMYYITWTLVSVLIGAFLWLLKTLLFKILALKFYLHTFFDRTQESIVHQCIIQTLVRPREEAEKSQCLSFSTLRRGSTPRCLSFNRPKIGNARKKEEVIDMGKLQKMKPEEVSASTKEVLVDAVSSSVGLSTFSYTLDEMGKKEITNEMEAVAAAKYIFWNVAPPGERYIEERDFMEFMNKEELDLVWPLIDVANTGRLNRRALRAWVVKVFNGRKALNHALTDTKAAIKQLNNLVTSIVVVVSIVVWLLLVEIATTKVLVFLSSQLVLAAFMFGNTCKNIFEAIVFVFVIHPFDVGDRCVVDDVPLMVEKMNILTTVFLKLNNEMVYYPNSVLATKTISNYYRSSNMGDTVEFSIALTPVEKIRKLQLKIKAYLEQNPQYWHPNHNLVVMNIEDVNKLKMALKFNHLMNFQELVERDKRRTELIMELMEILEQLNISYCLLPQDVSQVQTKNKSDAGAACRKSKSM